MPYFSLTPLVSGASHTTTIAAGEGDHGSRQSRSETAGAGHSADEQGRDKSAQPASVVGEPHQEATR